MTFIWFQHKQDKGQIAASTRLSSLVFDLLNGVQKIKITGSQKRAFTKWLQTYKESARYEYNPPTILKISGALMVLVNLGGIAFIYMTAVKNNIAPSDFIAFNAAYGMVGSAFTALISIVPKLSRMKPLLEQAQPIMDEVPEVDEKSKQIHSLNGAIEVSHLSFRYSEDTPWILNDISLKIRPREYVAIVGKSGCGKSTLLRLLLGFETPQSGAIFYDDYDLNEVDKSSLRQKIGTCLQSGTLFPGDIFSNITITAPWSTREDAWEAARLAGIDEDIRALPMGMNTLISEGGGGFSGGQKQRLLIARALMNKPSILFFDEATSALDNVSQKMVSDNLDKMRCTRVVIAHRLSTIRHCNRIIVLDKGHIVEEGTFEQLKAKGGLFADMIKRQEI
jgi:ABC-type bacteriocin/lantibiotic exporter with double-glycine peptidase domain